MPVTLNASTGITFKDSSRVVPADFNARFGKRCGMRQTSDKLVLENNIKIDGSGFWTSTRKRFSTRPAIYPNTPSIVAFGYRNSAGTLTVPQHNVGDLILFSNGHRSSTAPGLTSGFTNINHTSGGYSRAFRWQYRISTTGGSQALSVAHYGYYAVIRDCAGIGAHARYVGGGSGGSIPLPTLSGCAATGKELILAGTYTGGYASGVVPSPYDGYLHTTFLHENNNTNKTLTPSSEFDVTSKHGDVTMVCEFLPKADV